MPLAYRQLHLFIAFDLTAVVSPGGMYAMHVPVFVEARGAQRAWDYGRTSPRVRQGSWCSAGVGLRPYISPCWSRLVALSGRGITAVHLLVFVEARDAQRAWGYGRISPRVRLGSWCSAGVGLRPYISPCSSRLVVLSGRGITAVHLPVFIEARGAQRAWGYGRTSPGIRRGSWCSAGVGLRSYISPCSSRLVVLSGRGVTAVHLPVFVEARGAQRAWGYGRTSPRVRRGSWCSAGVGLRPYISPCSSRLVGLSGRGVTAVRLPVFVEARGAQRAWDYGRTSPRVRQG